MFAYFVKAYTYGGTALAGERQVTVMAEDTEHAFRQASSYFAATGSPCYHRMHIRRSRAKSPDVIKRCPECGVWQVAGRERRYNHQDTCQSQYRYQIGERVEYRWGDSAWVSGVVLGRKRDKWTGEHVYTISKASEMDSQTFRDHSGNIRPAQRWEVWMFAPAGQNHNWHNKYGPAYVSSGFRTELDATTFAIKENQRNGYDYAVHGSPSDNVRAQKS